MRYWLFLLLILNIASCKVSPSADTEISRWEAHAANTTIIRDDFGVPHVYGKTDADAVLVCFMLNVRTILTA